MMQLLTCCGIVSVTLILALALRSQLDDLNRLVGRLSYLERALLVAFVIAFVSYGGDKPPVGPVDPPIEPVVTNTVSYLNLEGAVNTNVTEFTTNDLPLVLGPVEREGWRFLGWTPNDGVIPVGTVTNVTMYAVWTANAYSVKFDANGGEGTMADQAFLYDAEQALTSNAFTRTGCAFAGWARDAATGMSPPQLADAEIVSNLTAEAGGVVTLYAQWREENPGTIVTFVTATRAGQTMVVTFRRTGGSDGRIAVKVKTQTSTALMGTDGSADFDYVKDVLVWEDGDSSDRTIEIPTYATTSSTIAKQLRVKLATLATGLHVGNLVPTLAETKVYATILPLNPGTIVVSGPYPLSVKAGEVLRMRFARVGGSDGSIAVKAKTQTSTALMGTNGSADFDYVKEILTWGPGDTSERYIDIPTYATDWQGEPKMLRVKLATLATGAYAGNLVPTLAESKIYATIENAYDFGTVTVTGPDPLAVVAGETARLVFSRLSGCDGAIAVKYKVQTSTAVAGVDFDYLKGVLVWNDGEFDDKVVEVPTYDTGNADPNLMFRVKLSTLTQGAYEGCVTPKLESAKVYVPIVTAYNFGEFHGSVSTLVVPSIDIPVWDPSIFTDWPQFPEVPGSDTRTEQEIIEEWLSRQDDIPESDYYGADE